MTDKIKQGNRARLPREVRRALRLDPIELAGDRESLALLEHWKELDDRCARRHGEAQAAVRRADALAALDRGRVRHKRPGPASVAIYEEVLAGRFGIREELRLWPFSWLAEVARLARQMKWSEFCSRRPIELVEAVVDQGAIFQSRSSRAVGAVAAMACHGGEWLRPPAGWRPSRSSIRAQVDSLAEHLFAEYPLPACFRGVWSGADLPELRWYLHLARGGSIRTAPDLPFVLSKRAVVHFLRAPAELRPRQALRYAQVRAMGGTELQARGLAATDLGTEARGNEDFWRELARWLVRHPEVGPGRYQQIVDWADWRRHQPAPDGDAPLQPNLSFSGRCPAKTLREVTRWVHEEERDVSLRGARWPVGERCETWVRSLQDGLDVVEYRVVPLTSARELNDEGRRMKNCVAGYAEDCVKGESSILSLRRSRLLVPGVKRLATLEICEGELCEAKAKANEEPSPEAWEVILAWAKERGFPLDTDLRPQALGR